MDTEGDIRHGNLTISVKIGWDNHVSRNAMNRSNPHCISVSNSDEEGHKNMNKLTSHRPIDKQNVCISLFGIVESYSQL